MLERIRKAAAVALSGLALAAPAVLLTSCEDDDFEDAGEEIDEAFEDLGEEIEDIGD